MRKENKKMGRELPLTSQSQDISTGISLESLEDLEDIQFLEQYDPHIVCVNNVWGLTNDYLHAVKGRTEHARHGLKGLLNNTPYLKKAIKLAKARSMLCKVSYGKVINWRNGEFETLYITASTLDELKDKLSKELREVETYLCLLDGLLQLDANEYYKNS